MADDIDWDAQAKFVPLELARVYAEVALAGVVELVNKEDFQTRKRVLSAMEMAALDFGLGSHPGAKLSTEMKMKSIRSKLGLDRT